MFSAAKVTVEKFCNISELIWETSAEIFYVEIQSPSKKILFSSSLFSFGCIPYNKPNIEVIFVGGYSLIS